MQNNNIEMHSTYNEGKTVVAERFIRTSKNKIYKYITSISKKVYIDKLDDIVINTTKHIIEQLNWNQFMWNQTQYNNSSKEINNKHPKFKIGDHVGTSKYKNIFTKGYVPNWSEEVFVITKDENTVPWSYVTSDLRGEKLVRKFYEKELQKTNQKGFRVEKVIKRQGDKLYVKLKGYDNSFNTWIDKKGIV